MTENLELWPGGVPGALGDEAEDHPYLACYAPAAGNNSGSAVIVCPGGGYVRRADHEGEPVARWLNQLGITAFVLHYRVSPYRHPIPLADARRAVRLVRHRAREWGYDRDKVGILGFSAGGHLAASVSILQEEEDVDPGSPGEEAGTMPLFAAGKAGDAADEMSARPDLMMLCYPVVSMLEFRHQGSHDHLLGENQSDSLRRRLSLDTQIKPQTPPAFIWHTSDDDSVPVENSLRLAAELSRHSVPFELHCFESGRHGLGLAEDHAQAYAWTDLGARWLRKQGWTP